jgi:hypothetical protein
MGKVIFVFSKRFGQHGTVFPGKEDGARATPPRSQWAGVQAGGLDVGPVFVDNRFVTF